MRVITVTWHFPDPTEPFIVDKVVGLAERGVESVVVAEPVRHPSRDVLNRLRGRVEIRRPPGNGSGTGYVDAIFGAARRDRPGGVRRAMALARLAARDAGEGVIDHGDLARALPLLDPRADVIHFEHAGTAVAHRRLLGRLPAIKIVTCHGSDVRVAPNRPGFSEHLSKVFANVDVIHCVSGELADRCIALGARPDQIHVAPLGVDLSRFVPRPAAARPEGLALRVVSVARLHWVKGFEYALSAVRLLRDAGHRVIYTVVGADDGGADQFRLAVADMGLEEVVTLAGPMTPDGVRETLAASDIFLLSSVSEGASVATMEAMAMGLPVVVTDVGGMREMVTDGEHGYVVASRSPVAMAAAVERLLDVDLRRRMGERGRARAEEEFDSAIQLDRLVGVYKDLVASRRPEGLSHAYDDGLISVVIVAHNAGATIGDQLRALSFQAYDGRWEVVVVDNASTDDTVRQTSAWAGRLPGLRVVDASAHCNIAYARNAGVRAARGSCILICDADDVVAPGWLAALAASLTRHPLVIGPLEHSDLAPAGMGSEARLDTGPRTAEGFRVRVVTGNVGFTRDVFDAVGGFDEGLRRGEDIDFGWRAHDSGFDPHFIAHAVVHVRARSDTSAVVRQGFADGRAGPDLYLRHRGAGMAGPSWEDVRSRYADAARGAISDAWSSPQLRNRWAYDSAQCAGRAVGSLRKRVRYL